MRISDWSSDVCSSDLILKAWKTTEPFSWEGEQYKFSTVAIWPKITQRPHPPVFGSGNSDSSVVFAAQRRIGIAFSFAPPEVVKKWIELYRAECAKEGWEPTPNHILYRGITYCADTDEQAYADKIGRAHVCTPVTNSHLVCRLL